MKSMVSIVVLSFGLAVAMGFNLSYGPVNKQCPAGKAITRIQSKPDSKHGVLFKVECTHHQNVSPNHCVWTDYTNDVNRVYFHCPGDGVVTGLSSMYDKHRSFRRYKYRCCAMKSGRIGHCHTSHVMKDYGMDYNAPHGSFIRGFYSWLDKSKTYRLWQASVCKWTL